MADISLPASEDNASGFVVFMPWVTLPRSIRVGRFRFCPLRLSEIATVVDQSIAPVVERAVQCYVRRNGQPIESCTIVLRVRGPQHWNVPRRHWNLAVEAAKKLALACLSEQRFFEGHFSPHLNATMFRIIGQGVSAGSDQIAPYFARRGGGLQIGGLRFKDVVFQRPPQIEGTSCEVINERLLRALEKAERLECGAARAVNSSLETFLLANAEAPDLDSDSCVTLSAISFERLIEPTTNTAQGLASAFADYWAPFVRLTVANAKRIKPDEKYTPEQNSWPIHRKWMKELYEARSATVHQGPRSEFSKNWSAWQHLVLAAFAYPLTIKLRLAEAGLYSPNDRELAAFEVFDLLLDSSWGKGWRKPPEWSKILSMAEGTRAIHTAVASAMRKHEGNLSGET
ncbi:hypothetical protein [Bradyrhizobium sp.]|uniref:hypothetical protein n=1 Tax=Bradyrhizobium sp. TaxID=376 RepID=UPI001D2214C7|nr:hypothetical protein [Bradyrhizobium sp.]MBI5319156.1 hypothetical protein [Bradyrhizobium sp.]